MFYDTNNCCQFHRTNRHHVNSRDIMRHTVAKKYQHLELRSRTFCVDSQQIEERFEAAGGAEAVEEQPQVVQDLVLITQACKRTKHHIVHNHGLLFNAAVS